ncbi:MAG: SOS response-associated peptidase, partial [Acidimicrobiales bacterium]
LTFAGLFETWWDKSRPAGTDGEPDPETFMQTCVIVTTAAGEDMAEIHDRMPVILEGPDHDLWLDPDVKEAGAVTGLLVPARGGTLVHYPVDKAVNSPRNDGPHLIDPAPGPHAGAAADDGGG